MRIGWLFGAKEAKPRGINRAIRDTCETILKADIKNEYYAMQNNYLHLPIKETSKVELASLETQIGQVRIKEKFYTPDVVHSFFDTLNFKYYKSPKILTIHDLIPLAMKDISFKQAIYDRYSIQMREAAESADVIIAISEYTKLDIMKYYSIHEEKIRVVYWGRSYILNGKESDNSILEKYNLMNSDGYILSVGAIEPRKNIHRLIRAFICLKERNQDCDLKLVLTGNHLAWREYNGSEIIEQYSKYQEDIIFLGYVDEETLAVLYKHCKAFAFVSLYEGFGLPVLEAMGAGRAVILSETTSMPEVGGEAAVYCNPYEVESIVNALERVVMEDAFRLECERKSVIQAEKFTYEKTAKEILEIYRGLSV